MWDLIKGKTPILLVASHAYSQIRNRKLKPGDIGTGRLVRKLAESSGCWGLVSTKVQEDPNWYENSPFRKKIDDILLNGSIKAVLDIHGSKNKHDLLVYYPNECFTEKFVSLLAFKKLLTFKDNEQVTIAEHLNQMDIPAVQIEISKVGRIGVHHNEVLEELKNLVLKIGEK